MRNKACYLIDLNPNIAEIKKLVYEGLSKKPKQLPAWLLYDQEGSKLFEKICEQPEYSLPKTEILLLEQEAKTITNAIGTGVIVEFGAGNAKKVAPLLKELKETSYVALDISSSHLKNSLNAMKKIFPNIPIMGICCDHSQLETFPKHSLIDDQRKIGFFPGSSLGNFEEKEASKLLKNFRKLLDGGPLLIGLDHPKSSWKIKAAYNDSAGFSAAFAKNILNRLNRELNATFSNENFIYKAEWQPKKNRVEMKLVSKIKQMVVVSEKSFIFEAGEQMITEYSFKYTPEKAVKLFQESGWQAMYRWHDPADEYSLHLLKPLKIV